MDSGFGESSNNPPENASFSSNDENEASDFECNICFELAQEPILTLCGHLFCWPCLYKWLHIFSHSQECPVCKALVVEEKLVPLFGRGRPSTDPRSKAIPGINIPNRPTGQRPETAPRHGMNQHFPPHGFGFTGGFTPMGTTQRFGNFTLSAAFGGWIPSLFNIQVNGFPFATSYGAAAGFPPGFSSFHGGHGNRFSQHRPTNQDHQADSLLTILSLVVVFVILALLFA